MTTDRLEELTAQVERLENQLARSQEAFRRLSYTAKQQRLTINDLQKRLGLGRP